MLKKTITFEDLDGGQVTEDFYFHLTKAELAELEVSQRGGFMAHVETITKSEDNAAILAAFKQLVAMTIGERSPDGRRFVKSPEITDNFMQTDAYSELIVEFATNEQAAADFINGVVPASVRKQIVDHELPTGEKAELFTDEELLSMSDSEFDRVAGTDPKKMSHAHLMIAMQRRNKAA